MENKKKLTMEEVPGWFAMCNRNDCTVCDQCLHYMAFRDVVTEKQWAVSLVNPLRVVPNGECEFFKTDEPATFARGFKKMQREMLPGQYEDFSCKLIGKFGRTGYYERRRGERLCSPAEIEKIRAVMQEIGLPNLEFDEYVKQINW